MNKKYNEIKNNEGIADLIHNCENHSTLADLDKLAEESKFDIRMIPAYVKVFFINLKIGLMKMLKK